MVEPPFSFSKHVNGNTKDFFLAGLRLQTVVCVIVAYLEA